MCKRALPFVLAMSLTAGAQAQIISQPTPAPLVTADTAVWFSRVEPVQWNGALYCPAGAQQPFNPHQMVLSGSFKGIPLYTDSMAEPGSTVFIPLSGGLMSLYQRRVMEGAVVTVDGALQPPPTPIVNVACDTLAPPAPVSLRSLAEPIAVGTSGRLAAPPALRAEASTMGALGTEASADAALSAEASAKAARRVSSLIPPTGVNGIWVSYDGRRWFLAGKAIDYDPATLAEVGKYHGWSVYTRNGDRSTIYIPTTAGRLAPYVAR